MFVSELSSSLALHLVYTTVPPVIWWDVCVVVLELDEDEYVQFGGDWDKLRSALTQKFLSRTQAEWTEIFDGTDACVTPVVDLESSQTHPHNHKVHVSA